MSAASCGAGAYYSPAVLRLSRITRFRGLPDRRPFCYPKNRIATPFTLHAYMQDIDTTIHFACSSRRLTKGGKRHEKSEMSGACACAEPACLRGMAERLPKWRTPKWPGSGRWPRLMCPWPWRITPITVFPGDRSMKAQQLKMPTACAAITPSAPFGRSLVTN